MKSNYATRIRVISIGLFLFALILIGKLYFLQIVHNDYYTQKADRQYTSTSGNIFSRGSIYLSNKDGSVVSGATLQSGFTVAINPKLLTDPEGVYKKLNVLLPLDHSVFITKATKPNDPYEELAKHVDSNIGSKIQDLNITGLKIYKDRWRFYPGGQISAHTIGILGYKGNDFAGRYGLERSFESTLARKEGSEVNFFAQIFSDIASRITTSSASEGDVVTTIEPTVEAYLENILASTTEKWNAEEVGGIIMNPQNGEIYAMESYPTFNPNNSQSEKNVNIFSNPLVENVYEMGSIIKPLTVSAAVDQGLITATSTFYDQGFVMINGKKISDFDGKNRGTVTIQDLLSQSLNVGAAHVESLLGNKLFAQYFYNFGLNQKTGIELPNEGKNLVDNLKSPRDIEPANASFGQGIALTPISTIRALATIANGGLLITPHIVKKINYTTGLFHDTTEPEPTRVLKSETSVKVSQMLIHSVDYVLLNGKLHLTNYSVAAKTGTAQIAKQGGGGYSETDFLHSFIGYFPAYNPKFIILLYMVKPHGARYGSETLTIPFMNIVNFLINYYEVPPDRAGVPK